MNSLRYGIITTYDKLHYIFLTGELKRNPIDSSKK